MKKLPIGFLVVLLLPALTLAAQVFGSLRYQGVSVGENVEVFVRCLAQKAPPQKGPAQKGPAKKGTDQEVRAKTDKYGAYKVFVRGPAKCELSVNYQGKQSKAYNVYSDRTDPVRYDFDLRNENGALLLRRR